MVFASYVCARKVFPRQGGGVQGNEARSPIVPRLMWSHLC
jgi:hypothetical protein